MSVEVVRRPPKPVPEKVAKRWAEEGAKGATMAVGVERELDRGVAERGLDGLYVDERYTAKLLV